jgi:fatty-acyl-CoA synthase
MQNLLNFRSCEGLMAKDPDFLRPRPANHVPLSPISFLHRTAELYGNDLALVDGDRRFTWKQLHQRVLGLAAGLMGLKLQKGDVVSVLTPNTSEMFEAHFGVAMAGCVLNTINIRLDVDTVTYILDHAETKVLLVDRQCAKLAVAALENLKGSKPIVIDCGGPGDAIPGAMTYESLIKKGNAFEDDGLPADEWDTMCLNYTSGTSGRPKGVLYHHRGAYLMVLGTIAGWGLAGRPKYLYTVPMFHCNGWGHAWTMTALAATIICCRQVTAPAIYDAITTHGVTHFGGAPIVLGMLVEAEHKPKLPHKVQAMTAGAPPPAAILEKVEAIGFNVMQVYGLTETYGNVVQSIWHDDWDQLNFAERAKIKARQGVRFPMAEGAWIADPDTGTRLPMDGIAIGEIVLRGNTIMKGYHKDESATEAAFKHGVFHSADVAVQHPDGFLEIRDRYKDIIISGGENISSIEVESVLYRHPTVSMVAVVAKPDEKWGETPCAVIEFKPGQSATAEDLNAFCRQHLAGFKVPKTYLFEEIPKTATGKIEKYKLREHVRKLGSPA